MSNFSTWLQGEMDLRGWAQADLAHAANLSRATITKLIHNKSNPQLRTVEALSRAFDVPSEVIYRKAGLLSENPESHDPLLEEVLDLLGKIKSAERRKIALKLFRVLAE